MFEGLEGELYEGERGCFMNFILTCNISNLLLQNKTDEFFQLSVRGF